MPLSETEFSERFSRIRRRMSEAAIDCLVVAGRPDYFSRGNVRYLTGLGNGGYVVFPREGTPVHFVHPVQKHSPKIPAIAGPLDAFVDLRISSGDSARDVASVVQAIVTSGTVGVVGMGDIAMPVFRALERLLGPDRVVDAGAILGELRALKSPAEIERMRQSAQIADEVGEALQDLIHPGISDYEILGTVKRMLFERGSEYSLEVIDARGKTFNFTSFAVGDLLADGGTLFMEVTPAFDGYYAQLPICLPVGTPTPELRDLALAWQRGYEAGEALLRPGTIVAELSATMTETINEAGYLTPYPQGHAIGLDVVDGWSIHGANELTLQPGMTLVMHPCALAELGGDGFTAGYTYVITEDGAERLSRLDFALR